MVVGQCGNCGGQVSVLPVTHGVFPPVARCVNCGATAAQPAVLPMNPPEDKGNQHYAGAITAPKATYVLGDY